MRRTDRPHRPPASIAAASIAAAAVSLLLTGCLGDPAPRTCADFPRDTPECADYWAARSDAEVEPVGDVGPSEPDADLDQRVEPDRGPDTPDQGRDDAVIDYDEGLPRDAMIVDAMIVDADLTECVPGTSRVCGTDEGPCESGQEFCTPEGIYSGECLESIGPTEEICDGIDNDCDGIIDLGCECAVGDTRECGTDVGACAFGEQACVDGLWALECAGEVVPQAETCNGLDDDCNGTADDHPAVGTPCAVGLGICRAEGMQVCRAGLAEPSCDASPGRGTGERCNQLDDDCDGTTDEGLPAALDTATMTTVEAGKVGLAGSIEFHGALYIGPDNEVWYALLSGDDYEIEPMVLDDYPGRDADSYAEALDLEPIVPSGDFAFAVSVGDVGGVFTDVGRMTSGGRIVERRRIDGFGARLSVAFDGELTGVAWEAEQEAGGVLIGFNGGDGDVLFEGAPRTVALQPSLAWNGETYGLVWVQLDPRADHGTIWFRPVRRDGNSGQPVRIGEGTGRHPDLRWVSQLQRYVLAWSAVVRDESHIQVALLTAQGELDGGIYSLGGTDARWPSVAPFEDWRRQEPVDRIAIVYRETAGNHPTLFTRWLLRDDRAWTVSAVQTQLDSAQVSASRPVAAYAADGAELGVLTGITPLGRTASATYFSGNFGCPTSPALREP